MKGPPDLCSVVLDEVAAPSEPDADAQAKAKAHQAKAHQALTTLVLLARKVEHRSIGATCAALTAEMAAVHPEWNRAGRRGFVASFRRKGHR